MTVVVDQFGRPMQDLRISVTDRCNFRCRYCMPKEIFGRDFAFMPKEQLLTFEEIERLARIFVDLGIKKIRLTGGEPLLRKGLPDLISRLTNIQGLEDLGLTTNGVLLEKMAVDLKNAGLKRVNVSLDALDETLCRKINDSGVSSTHILKGIHRAKDVGLHVKVNMVVKKGMNEQEVVPMAKYMKQHAIPLRYIEFMDVGSTNQWDFRHVLTKKEIYSMLTQHFDLEKIDPSYTGEVAQRYRYRGTDTEVGFITSVSESFCSTCTRIRIAADGKLYTCLFAEKGYDLKKLLRSTNANDPIKETIRNIWSLRKDRYSDERTEQSVKQRKKIEMSYIGG
ncbi:GTP 3',8-cyclase MoaA [Fervidibacillus albus]|uniref:GTP 3',8-cyclase n=1 Tax=Fervidibacillus albus TaxID=2980026 RepID=A0A9E8LTZ5_9BACI|nr:GTP 3',8-cyclase MoaA [Fervidibacillus albus]WAA09335.1 GTP 3',8-cyclase MoaA [Fervidibacillus albus]